METLNDKLFEADANASGEQSESVYSCGGIPFTLLPENTVSDDVAVVNEVEHLLHMYQFAIDGGIWSNYDGIFDDVQDVEYELAPEYNLPVAPEDDDITSTIAEEQLSISSSEPQDTKEIVADTLSYIKQSKKFKAIIAGTALIMVALLIILGTASTPENKPLDNDVQLMETIHTPSTESPEAPRSVTHEQDYQNAVSLMDAGKYDEAIVAFEALSDYNDSSERLSQCHYIKASNFIEIGNTLGALREFSAAGDYKDAAAQAADLRMLYLKILQKSSVSISRNHTAVLTSNGTVVTIGSNDFHQCDVSDWTDIVSVSAGDTHTIGLKADGKVVAAGAVNYNQCNVAGWNDIVSISARRNHTIGLKADGSVVAAGRSDHDQCDVHYWKDIICVSTGEYHTVGLKSDGMVLAVGSNSKGQCDVSEWTDIVAVYAGDNHTVGLKADGTVVATGYNSYGQCDVSEWTDIIDIGIGNSYTVGLKADGTVVTCGYQQGDLPDVSGWSDIIDIAVGVSHVVGLKADGTVVSINYSSAEESNMSSWNNIKIPE